MTTTEHIRNTLTNHIMPSQSNDMLSYEVYSDNTSHVTCSEGEPLFQEETGKYDLDTVSVFVAKLYQLLDCDDYKEYLTWNDTGDVFVICNMDEFAQNVLPKYFKHCKFTSFVRQLNIYGFYRVSDARKSKHVRSKNACVFSHSQFRRGRQDLLPNIRRKVTKTVRRKPRNTDASLSQNHGDGSSSSQSIYGSNSISKSGNGNKDLSGSNSSINIYSDSKDFLLCSERSDNDTVMRKRIADLTATTENLRKDLKQISSIVNESLLPEVRSLTEGLHKHHAHLIALTQLVTCAFPEGVQSLGVQLLQDVTRGYTRHMPYDIPSKRIRLDDKPTVKTEQTPVPTVPSSRVPPSYNLFTSNSSNPNSNSSNNLMNGNNSSPTESSLQTSSVTPSALTIPSDSQSTFNNIQGSSIMGEFQQSPHNTQQNLTGFNESWSNTTSVMMTDPVNTVPSSNISYIFPTTTTTQSPILYSPSPNQQHSPPLSHHSHHSQVPSRSSSIALSPTEFVENSANSNSNDMLTNAPTVTSPTQINTSGASGANSPVHQGDVVVASSPASNSSSPITSTAPTNLSNFYHTNPILHMDMYGHSFSNY